MTANDNIGRGLAAGFANAERNPGCSGNMTAVQNEVWSYRERIAYRGDDGRVYVTKKKWSVTTTRHTSWVRYELSRAGYVNRGEDDTEEWEVWDLAREEE